MSVLRSASATLPEASSPWHSMAVAEVLAAVGASERGLASAEAQRRLGVHGPNRLRPPKRRSAVVRFLLQFHNVLKHVDQDIV